MKKPPSISILICSNRAPAVTDRLLSSITGQGVIEGCEVVFVDNGLEDRRAAEVRRALSVFPCETKYVVEEKPGIWATRKTSYENARGEWLFILDDDNILAEGALSALYGFIDAHPEVGGVCPRIVAEWEVEAPDWLQIFGRLWCLSYTESGRFGPGIGETVWMPGQPGACNPPGGGMIIRREAAEAFLESYGGIPESLRSSRLGSEDYALYTFAGRLGYATAYVPSVTVFHHMPKERLKIRYLTRLNLRMAYAYGQLAHSWQALTIMGMARTAYSFGRMSFTSPPLHPWALWLDSVRTAGFLAGLCRAKINK